MPHLLLLLLLVLFSLNEGLHVVISAPTTNSITHCYD
jgi:hypothetical protein